MRKNAGKKQCLSAVTCFTIAALDWTADGFEGAIPGWVSSWMALRTIFGAAGSRLRFPWRQMAQEFVAYLACASLKDKLHIMIIFGELATTLSRNQARQCTICCLTRIS